MASLIYVKYIVLACFCAAVTLGKEPGPWCYDCKDARDPNECTHLRECPSGDTCSTELIHDNHNRWIWKFRCKKPQDCFQFSRSLFGKRKRNHPPPPPDMMCSDCCRSDDGCNKRACPRYGNVIPTTTPTTLPTTVSTTPTTTNVPTTGSKKSAQPSSTSVTLFPCIDLETSTLNCTNHAAQGHCAHISGRDYELAKLRCRKTCGFCK